MQIYEKKLFRPVLTEKKYYRHCPPWHRLLHSAALSTRHTFAIKVACLRHTFSCLLTAPHIALRCRLV